MLARIGYVWLEDNGFIDFTEPSFAQDRGYMSFLAVGTKAQAKERLKFRTQGFQEDYPVVGEMRVKSLDGEIRYHRKVVLTAGSPWEAMDNLSDTTLMLFRDLMNFTDNHQYASNAWDAPWNLHDERWSFSIRYPAIANGYSSFNPHASDDHSYDDRYLVGSGGSFSDPASILNHFRLARDFMMTELVSKIAHSPYRECIPESAPYHPGTRSLNYEEPYIGYDDNGNLTLTPESYARTGFNGAHLKELLSKITPDVRKQFLKVDLDLQ